MTHVKERPILFSGAMVRALLDGTKTQTRRVVKHDCSEAMMSNPQLSVSITNHPVLLAHFKIADGKPRESFMGLRCPYGQPGERLVVRETLYFDTCGDEWCYQADNSPVLLDPYTAPILLNPAKKSIPSIHMPREAARLVLEIVSVRVERLNAISAADAVAEGIEVVYRDGPDVFYKRYSRPGKWHKELMPINSYETLWESINGVESWKANPWVWVVEFKVVPTEN